MHIISNRQQITILSHPKSCLPNIVTHKQHLATCSVDSVTSKTACSSTGSCVNLSNLLEDNEAQWLVNQTQNQMLKRFEFKYHWPYAEAPLLIPAAKKSAKSAK